MKFKKNRSMTVAYASGHRSNDVPMIRMQGEWLQDLGFSVGSKINVECQGGRLIITNEDEALITSEEAL